MIRTAVENQQNRVSCVHVENPALTRGEFVELLAARFGLSPHAGQSKAAFLLELERLLVERRRADETTVLIVDEAQSLPLELLEEIRLLANIETADEKLLSVIIAGQPELASRLDDDNLRQLKQRVALRCELRLLTLTETAAYLAGRIRAAGGAGAQVFTREAVQTIYENSKGIPRTINVLADNALLSAFAAGERPVRRDTVLEVCSDFRLGNQAGQAAPESTPPPLVEPAAAPGSTLVLDTAEVAAATDATSAVEASADSAPTRSRFSLFGRN
jgi:general secretion pathway protein A